MLATPLQLAAAVATLANGGVRMQPRTVRAIQDPESLATAPTPLVATSTVAVHEQQHLAEVIAAMTEVVHGKRGTAKAIGKDAGYMIAGKTGTAQVFSLKQDEKYDATKVDERLRDHAWFVAFAPVEHPRIAIAVLVENGGSGSGTAAPIARAVMDHYLVGNAKQPTLNVNSGE
jgi:penicillin-binding protein 2